MKKIITITLCLVLMLALGTAMIGCGGECAHSDADGDGKCDSCGEATGTPPADDTCTAHNDADKNGKCDKCGETVSTAPTEDKVELVKDGSAQFQVVMDAEAAAKNSANVMSAVDKINQRLSGTKVTVSTEAQSTETTYEILIGSVASRGDAYVFDKHDYGAKGYIIKVIGSKICVVAGSDDAVSSALNDLLKEFFGIKNNKVNPIDNLTVTPENNIDETQTGYAVSELKVGGKKINDFAIVVNDSSLNNIAKSMQNSLYYNVGIWLDIVAESNLADGQGAVRLNLIENGGAGTTEDGFNVYVVDGDLVIDCEFANKFSDAILEFMRTKIFNAGKSKINLTDSVYTQNVRDIYYEEFNAKGDGRTDDFEAIKATHDYANIYGHTVNADRNKTYYIGNKNGSSSIVVKTDTNWNGCKFIFDDSEVLYTQSSERATPIFHIASDYSVKTFSGTSLPFTSLEKGTTNIGYAPGFKALIIVYNANVKHYIRYGENQNEGFDQQEIIMVDENGNVDPSTPVQWSYGTITKIELIRADDKPITFSGGTRDDRALVETIFNGAALSDYNYYWRNIYINRSNVILENIEHIITDDIPEKDGGTGAPYQGFTLVRKCANITVQGMTYQHPEFRHVYNNPNNRMGSYEMNASHCHNITWRDCDQSNFFNADGSVTFHGMMGTNYCKNLTFDNMFVCSFDAHEGVYNATIKNSTCEHMNFIGDGLITIENTTVYVDGEQHAAMNLRGDYGSTWWGDIYIDGLTMKCAESMSEWSDICLIRVEWYNWEFGYETSLPQNITMKNVNIQEYQYGIYDSGERWEKIVSTNKREMYIYPKAVGHNSANYDDPDATIQEKPNKNPYTPTKTITVTNGDLKNPLKINWMTNPMFKDTVITVDGKKIKN